MSGYRYTREVATAVREVPKPFKFTMDIVEHDQPKLYYVELRLYDNEVLAMDDNHWQQCLSYLLKVKSVIQLFGIRC